jgi:hypothetical protein
VWDRLPDRQLAGGWQTDEIAGSSQPTMLDQTDGKLIGMAGGMPVPRNDRQDAQGAYSTELSVGIKPCPNTD